MAMPRSLPTVTCVVTAFNHERFVPEAIDSALDQSYPPELLDVVVVDDGSTDGTGRLLDERFAEHHRVTVIHQDNRGFVGAMNRALGEARGELVAILDGDDVWPLDKLSRQVPVLVDRAEVGLVHGDMAVVDVHGGVIHESFFAYSGFDVRRGRVLGRLIAQNFVSGGASVFRRGFLDELLPMPAEALYPDWYIAAGIAQRAEIDHVDGSVSQYRQHGSNMGLGGTGRKFFSDMRNNVRIQRWMLATLDVADEPVEDLAAATKTMLSSYGTGRPRARCQADRDPRGAGRPSGRRRTAAAPTRARRWTQGASTRRSASTSKRSPGIRSTAARARTSSSRWRVASA